MWIAIYTPFLGQMVLNNNLFTHAHIHWLGASGGCGTLRTLKSQVYFLSIENRIFRYVAPVLDIRSSQWEFHAVHLAHAPQPKFHSSYQSYGNRIQHKRCNVKICHRKRKWIPSVTGAPVKLVKWTHQSLYYLIQLTWSSIEFEWSAWTPSIA